MTHYQGVVMGCSAGGMEALRVVLSPLPASFPVPILVVQHVSQESDRYLIRYLNKHTKLTVLEAEEKEAIKPGRVYVAPPGYHLLVEKDHTLSLTIDAKVHYSRPSIDVLFETAAWAFQANGIGILLTGASQDGASGLLQIKKQGGMTLVEDPDSAESRLMPLFAVQADAARKILPLEEIPRQLCTLMGLSL
ncbi:MAG: chemotaxis protein CheB [Magnetococcales bacterium]|nr:chemotaxis protein CheB [Magnetococcales bacterium]